MEYRNMIKLLDTSYGPESSNLIDLAARPGRDGALNALESFYYAFNHRDLDIFNRVWSQDPLAQLNNPLGGILRGGAEITNLYDSVFNGPVRVSVTFTDIVEFSGDDHAVFAGRETGEYSLNGGSPVSLSIRTSRYFRYTTGRWQLTHHHGSIDEAESLAAYQQAIGSGSED